MNILFIYIIYNAFTSSQDNEVSLNPWYTPSYFVSKEQSEVSTPFAFTLDFVVDSPVPYHVYNILPILTENKKNISIQ